MGLGELQYLGLNILIGLKVLFINTKDLVKENVNICNLGYNQI